MKRILYIVMALVASTALTAIEEIHAAMGEKEAQEALVQNSTEEQAEVEEALIGTEERPEVQDTARVRPNRVRVAGFSLTEESPDRIELVFNPKCVRRDGSITYLNRAPKCKYTVRIENTSIDPDHFIYFDVPGVGEGKIFGGGVWQHENIIYSHVYRLSLEKASVETRRTGKWSWLPCFSTIQESVGEGRLTIYKQIPRNRT